MKRKISKPWVPDLLEIMKADKIFDKNPLIQKNVKQYATRKKITILTMRGILSIQNKSIAIEDPVNQANTYKLRAEHK